MVGLLAALLACVIGLLLGSVLPADLLARKRGVDIRSVGDGNPGSVNAFHALGWGLGLVTVVYDALVGVVAIQIARVLGVSEGVSYLAGLAAIVGHRFPVFYGLKRGGQGMAASAGLIVYGVGVALGRGWLSAVELAVLVAIMLVTFAWTRSDVAVALVSMPILVALVAIGESSWQFLAFITVVAAHIWLVQLQVFRHRLRFPSAKAAR